MTGLIGERLEIDGKLTLIIGLSCQGTNDVPDPYLDFYIHKWRRNLFLQHVCIAIQRHGFPGICRGQVRLNRGGIINDDYRNRAGDNNVIVFVYLGDRVKCIRVNHHPVIP